MKNLVFIFSVLFLVLASCGPESEKEEKTDENEPKIDLPYEQGGASTAEDYFKGLEAHLKRVDTKLRHIRDLDDLDASEDSIRTELDSIILLCAEDKEILKLYESKDWPKKKDLQELTISWYNAVESLVNDHFSKLAEPMSRPDDTWTESDKELYGAYETAYFEEFYVIDQDWVAFQKEFAAANNIPLKEEEPEL